MLKVGLIGLGAIGRIHLENYIRLESEGYPITLTAVCDVNIESLKRKLVEGNISSTGVKIDMGRYRLYTSLDEMLEKERFDFVDITLPTFLHPDAAVKALNKGIHVICEKPMALSSAECKRMAEAADKNARKLMIAQCLRFWPEYEYLKKCVEDGRFGKVVNAFFHRCSGIPMWSHQNWLLAREKSGGVIFDLHVHDTDIINWLFGKPKSVSTLENFTAETGYDAVCTNYIYDDGKVVNAQAEWVVQSVPFEMQYRVNFEKGTLIYRDNVLKVYRDDGSSYIPDLEKETGYYRELKYFADSIIKDFPVETVPKESTRETIEIVEAEAASAAKKGLVTAV